MSGLGGILRVNVQGTWGCRLGYSDLIGKDSQVLGFIHPIASYHHLSCPILMKVDIQSPCYCEPLQGGRNCFARCTILGMEFCPNYALRDGSILCNQNLRKSKSAKNIPESNGLESDLELAIKLQAEFIHEEHMRASDAERYRSAPDSSPDS